MRIIGKYWKHKLEEECAKNHSAQNHYVHCACFVHEKLFPQNSISMGNDNLEPGVREPVSIRLDSMRTSTIRTGSITTGSKRTSSKRTGSMKNDMKIFLRYHNTMPKGFEIINPTK